MLTILASSQTGMQARQMLDRKPPTCRSILSSCTSLAVFCRATAGELSSSAITSSIGRPLTPPEALMRSAAICRPTTAVLPPAAPAPDSGCSEPILNGWAAPKAARHGAGTSMAAPIAPAPQPTMLRRVTLPRYQISLAHASSFHFSTIVLFLQLEFVQREARPGFCPQDTSFTASFHGGPEQALGRAIVP